jgi:hypothetical protein
VLLSIAFLAVLLPLATARRTMAVSDAHVTPLLTGCDAYNFPARNNPSKLVAAMGLRNVN